VIPLSLGRIDRGIEDGLQIAGHRLVGQGADHDAEGVAGFQAGLQTALKAGVA